MVWVHGLPMECTKVLVYIVQGIPARLLVEELISAGGFMRPQCVVQPMSKDNNEAKSATNAKAALGNGEKLVTDTTATSSGDRKEEGVVSRVDQNTKYTESVGIVVEVEPQGMLRLPLDPYLPSGVQQALKRSYRMNTLTWDSTSTVGAILFSADFPYDFINAVPTMQNLLTRHRYLRGKVKLTFSVNCTSMEEGSLILSWAPAQSKTSLRGNCSVGALQVALDSMRNPILLSATQGQSVTFEIPWIFAKAWYDLLNPIHWAIGSARATVLHPLVSTSPNPPTDVTIAVYCSFVDVELAGYDPISIVTAEAQSGMSNEQATKSATGLVAGVPMEQSDSTFSQLKGILSDVTQVVGAFSKVASLVGGSAPLDMSNTTITEITSSTVEVRTKRPGVALAPSRDCLVPKLVGIMSFDNPSAPLDEICRIPGLIRFGSITNAAFLPGRRVELILNRPSGFTYSTVTDVVVVPTYAMHYANQATYWRGKLVYMFKFQCAKNVTCRVRIIHCPSIPADPLVDDFTGDYVSAVVDVTGDTVFMFKADWLSDSHYLEADLFAPRIEDQIKPGAGYIAMFLESVIGSMDTTNDPPVYYSIWQAAGEDFELQKQRARAATYNGGDLQVFTSYVYPTVSFVPVPPENKAKEKRKKFKTFLNAEAQCDVRTVFSNSSPDGLIPSKTQIIHNLCFADKLNSVTDMMRRPQEIVAIPAGVETGFTPYVQALLTPLSDELAILASPFLFQRGGMMVAVVPDNADYICFDGVTPDRPFGNGQQLLGQKVEWILLPWNTPYGFVEVLPEDFSTENSVEVRAALASTVIMSVADDYCLGHPSAPPFIVLKPPATTEVPKQNMKSPKMVLK